MSCIVTIHGTSACSPSGLLVTPNSGLPSISNNTACLDPNALLSLTFPPSRWASRVAVHIGCNASTTSYWTGVAPPATLAQLTVHHNGDLAAYSVSLVHGFNVPMVVNPQAVGGRQCPTLGCAVDLNYDCPPNQRIINGATCHSPASYFQNRRPLTRTTSTDVEPMPQSCRTPGELKIVFCQLSMVGGAAAAETDMIIRTVVADS